MTDPTTFDDFDLDDRIKAAVARLGFDSPTPIQAQTIVPLRAGHDVIGRARTGSGKTAAFGLPLLEAVKEGGTKPRALVMAPTRELAMQVTEALRSYATQLPVRIITLYGGASFEPQLRALRDGVPVVVGTPGRLLDHLNRGTLDLTQIEMVVLDEADEMLRMGFIDDVETLLDATPGERQTVLFSATMPPPIQRVAQKHLSQAVEIQVESAALTTSHIEQRFLIVHGNHKLDALERLLAAEPREAVLIFARTRTSCADLADALCAKGTAAEALHGYLNQAARERVLRRLRAKAIDIVVATDVAARGIDVDHITHVVNYDLPDDVEQYVHRIGRTGRAGRSGVALNLVQPGHRRRLQGFERALKTRMIEAEVPSDAALQRRLLDQMSDALIATIEEDGLKQSALEHVAKLADKYDPASLAAAAMQLLAGVRGVEIVDDANEEPPRWRGPRDARPDRQRPERAHPGRDRDERRELGETVELFLPVGRRHGVEARNVVGALANEGGIPGAAIGRITILGDKTFATVEKAAAEQVLRTSPTLTLGGQTFEVGIARGHGGPPGRPSPRPGPSKALPGKAPPFAKGKPWPGKRPPGKPHDRQDRDGPDDRRERTDERPRKPFKGRPPTGGPKGRPPGKPGPGRRPGPGGPGRGRFGAKPNGGGGPDRRR
jgi:ATP-dependent RNA helicase DeaD